VYLTEVTFCVARRWRAAPAVGHVNQPIERTHMRSMRPHLYLSTALLLALSACAIDSHDGSDPDPPTRSSGPHYNDPYGSPGPPPAPPPPPPIVPVPNPTGPPPPPGATSTAGRVTAEPSLSSDEQPELTGAAETSLAAAPCTPRADGRWDCNNHNPAPIFDVPFFYGTKIDHLRHNTDWFECRGDFDPSGGGPHPYRWVFTQGDDFGKWGWVRDSDINSETNPIRVCL
jgi:hypothetical protein